MVFFKRKQPQGVAEIHLTPGLDNIRNVNKIRGYSSNDVIEGDAVYRLPDGVDFYTSRIVLRGTVITQSNDRPASSMQPSWRTERLPFLAVELESRAWPDLEMNNGDVRIPFRFNLRESVNLSGVVSELPPSLDSRNEKKSSSPIHKHHSETEFSVVYSISASAFSQRGLAASAIQKVAILPVSDAQPPLSVCDLPVSDFPVSGEHFLAHQSKVQLNKSTRARIEIAGQKPEPVIFNANDSASHSPIELPFLLKMSPWARMSLGKESLPDQIHLKAQLVTRTFITPKGSRRVPTIEQANREDSFVRTSQAHDQECNIAIPKWDLYDPRENDAFAIANFSFLFKLDGETSPVPTFFTSILSRRYAIDLAFTFPGSSKQSVKLSIPLQIVYDGNKYDSTKDKESVSE